ncbi:hypothetical protein BSLG_004961 [Batrachochytrium salamandrivorans]|nr:hypothetical protein BSLG_004961 [Batrachochytrium salamandrivorans]
MSVHLWLRAETKKNEQRAALTPLVCKALLAHGFNVTIEHCSQRIFNDSEYERMAGKMLNRFVRGSGLLLDLEFLEKKGRRVAAFGYHAGYAGAAVGLDIWCHQQLAPPSSPVPKQHPFANESELIKYLKSRLGKACKAAGKMPSIMVIGALGRCGSGACDLARAPITPFLTKTMLQDPSRVLSVLTDVSCDATNPHNPIPVYYGASTFDDPVIKVEAGSVSLDVIAIDHLPTLLPREASEAFCNDLLPSLLDLMQPIRSSVWTGAAALFYKKSLSLSSHSKL